MSRVVIGMDPHKRSATIEAIDERAKILTQPLPASVPVRGAPSDSTIKARQWSPSISRRRSP
jgi:hypothetical protein